MNGNALNADSFYNTYLDRDLLLYSDKSNRNDSKFRLLVLCHTSFFDF